jgi:hypothetical protein
MDRFKSLMVGSGGEALRTMAAYIETPLYTLRRLSVRAMGLGVGCSDFSTATEPRCSIAL